MHRNTIITIACAAVCAHGGFAVAQSKAETLNPTQDPGKPRLTAPVVAGDVKQMDATVVGINPVRRLLQLQSNAGRLTTVSVGPDIKGFDKIAIGDEVNAKFTQALAVSVLKGNDIDIRKKIEISATAQNESGAKPAVTTSERTTVVANVWEINQDEGTLSIRGTNGNPVDYQVKDKSTLADLNEDDQIIMSYVEATAVAIEAK